MNELLRIDDATYDRYKDLLIKKDVLKKEAIKYQISYLLEFGDLLNRAFESRIKCIEKKKIIAFCQARANKNQNVYQNEIDDYIDNVMASYYKQLQEMLKQSSDLKNSPTVSEFTLRKIKAIFRRIARLIHPDMNPLLQEDETIQDYWNRTCVAYETNNIEELEELEVLVNDYLKLIDYSQDDKIPNVQEKIIILNEEINQILNTDPYQYKYLLADEEAVKEKKQELEDEINDYQNYAIELDEIISSFKIERMIS